MGFWFAFFMWAASYVLADFFRPRLPEQTPSGLGDFNIPTATEGRAVPQLFGRMRMSGPNVVWYGDFLAARRTTTTGVIFRRRETIGYTYHLALQLVQFRGECAGMTAVWIGDDKVWNADDDNGGDPATVIDINEPDLFGGEDQGGGFVGRLRCHTGALDQAASTYLANHQDPLPAYRGYTYVVVTDQAETGGANIGESNTLRDIRIEFQAYDTVANGGLGDSLGLGNDHHIIGKDLNPIVLAYSIFTDSDWGRGLPVGDMNTSNFQTVAETVFTEGLGFSTVVDRVMDAAELIREIEQHVDAYIGPNPVTGQIEIILARQDYTLANEFQADGSVVESVTKFSRGEWSQTFNKVLVQYADRQKKYEDSYGQAHDMANRVIQGRLRAQTLRYSGVHEASVANQIAWREIRGLSLPLSTATVEMNRTAYALRPGSIFSLTDEEVEVENLAMRVLKIGKGDPLDATIVVEAIEDVWGTEVTGFANPPASAFVPPVQTVVPLAAADQAAVEAPFVLAQYDEQPDTIPRILTFARSTAGGNPTLYEIIRRVRATFGSGVYGAFESSDTVPDFAVVGGLRSALGGWASGNGAFAIAVDPIAGSLDALIGTYDPAVDNAQGVAVISPGTDDEEWLAITQIVDSGAGVELQGVWRACADTGMRSHSAGDRVWFVWTGGFGYPLETYAEGAGVEMKFLPRSSSDQILEAEATALAEVRIYDPPRYGRPLIPRSLSLNDVVFPAGDVNTTIPLDSGELGVAALASLRSWRVKDIVDSVRGYNSSGVPLSDTEITTDTVALEYWLYDLDTTPSPTRVDAIATGTTSVGGVSQTFELLRDDMIAAGVAADFAARLEIEIKHSPTGEEANQLSFRPFFFDFSAIGDWGATPQPAFTNVSLLLGFNGTDGQASTTDESNNAHAVTFIGNAQLDTEFKFFGTAALLLPLGDGDGIEVTLDSTLTLGGDDFCIEFMVMFPEESVGTYNPVLQGGIDSIIQDRYQMEYVGGSSLVRFVITNFGELTTTWDPEPGVWYHWSMVRDGNDWVGRIDGVPFDTADVTGLSAAAPSGGSLRLGRRRSGDPWADCSIDELRFTLGEPVYTGTGPYARPTAEHPRS